MKTLIISILLIMVVAQSKAQVLVTYADTANYLMNIENKKSDYIGKPFSILFDTLKIKPVWIITDDANIQPTFGKILRFYFNYEQEFDKKHILIVTYNTQPAYDIIYPLLFPGVGQPINVDAVINLYKSLVIQDVVVKNYYEDPDWLPALFSNTSVESDLAITAELKGVIANINATHKYANQPFSLLWNDLPVKPKTILGKTGTNTAMEKHTTFFFQTPDSLSITYIWVTWKDDGIPKAETQQYQVSPIRDFTDPQEYAIYANKIMDDVLIKPISLYPGGIPSPFSVPLPVMKAKKKTKIK